MVLGIVDTLFKDSSKTSKITLQVGLCSIVNNLHDFPALLPQFVQVLLMQPDDMRARLLLDTDPSRLAYVSGTSSRLYEEEPIHGFWPSALVARCIGQFAATEEFKPKHFQVLSACCRGSITGALWLEAIELLKDVLAQGLILPHSADVFNVLSAIWEDPQMAERSVEILQQPIVDVLGNNPAVDTSLYWENLREKEKEGITESVDRIIKSFREQYPAEFKEQKFVSWKM